MATQVQSLFRQAASKLILRRTHVNHCMKVPCRNNRVFTDAGAILPEPPTTKFGLAKSLFCVLPFLYLGATLSKNGAAWLEENDIFVPEDDDD